MSWEQGRNIIIENADNPDWDYNSLVEQLTKQNPRISAGTLSSLESFHNKMQGNSLELRKDDKFLVKWTHAMNTDQSFTEGAYEADLYNAFMNDRISKDEYFSGRSVLKQFAEGKMYRMDSL